MAVAPDGSKVYVVDGNNISIINPNTNAVETTIAVGLAPYDLAVTNDGTKIYTANNGSNNVSVINTVTSQVVATIPVGDSPFGITVTPDGSKVYVANGSPDDNNVSVINTATNAVDTIITVGIGPLGVKVTPDGSKVYVVNEGSDYVSVINTATNAVDTTVGVGLAPVAICIQPSSSLPVTFLGFSGEVNGKENLLQWATATEQNNTGFEIQRSNDGYNFTKIGFNATKANAGNSSMQLSYQYADLNFLAGTNYYRLKQIDKDGKSAYSNIVVLKDVNALPPGSITAYPNPAGSILNVKIASSFNNNNIALLITGLNGKLMLRKTTTVGKGETIIPVSIAQLPAGSYLLRIINGDGSKYSTVKFVKQ